MFFFPLKTEVFFCVFKKDLLNFFLSFLEREMTDLVFVNHSKHGRTAVTRHVRYLLEKDEEEMVPQKSAAWYEKRKKYLTASTIASICGDNKYESRSSAMKKKIGLEPSFSGNAATEHGNKFEPVAIEKYEEKHGQKVFSFGLLESINPGEEFLAGSPDGITATGRLIEVKCPFMRVPNGTVPFHYMHQIQTLLRILGLEVCDFIEYVPESLWVTEVFSVVEVRRDDNFWFAIFPKILSFHQDVVAFETSGKMPVILDSEKVTKPRKKTKKEHDRCMIEVMHSKQVPDNTSFKLPLVFFEALENKEWEKKIV